VLERAVNHRSWDVDVRVDQFDFELPDARIALMPVEPRDAARLLVVRPPITFENRVVRDLAELLRPGDALVMNDTRVLPAALDGLRDRDGVMARVAFNLIRRVDEARWRAFARPGKRLQVGDMVRFARDGADMTARISDKGEMGDVELTFEQSGAELDRALDIVGMMPLPPYIALKRPTAASDAATYQTVYARHAGAVAAPTAGLHMTHDMLARVTAQGVTQHFVTLHVGAGTFLPVKADDTRDHVMHSEWCEVSAETAMALNAARARGGRIVAVGTTALRVLESAAVNGTLRAFRGDTSIFITPGYRFQAVDVLMTNFHLPRSTLFMLVSAFAGQATMRAAYAYAIAQEYRFYSYGDGSLLFRDEAVVDV
jgi:S-adenosylmethionine:tRNA ribosyltransferase-isomerase